MIAGAGSAVSPNEVLARCEAWIALDAEIDRLGLRWSDLETILVRERRWERMTPDERVALSPTQEMDAIDAQLKPLFERREEWLEALPAVPARDLQGVIAKLEVALKVMVHQQGDGYALFKATMDELRTARCPRCASLICGA
ncbi:hypothetical protein [uncultured Caulobacter sp.]|uniref:hypothetical protein n=1 Tax=uncultured Caulobacter sp. TaxID=158749 RepID=UPI002602A3CD|nr:hypothetical protein [uncultured Caulobacter sp.]